MIPIYLCDDEEAVRHQIQTALEWKIFMENYDMKVVCAASAAQELLDAAEDGRRGVYFLDVDLKDGAWDGFTLGRELRRRDPHGTLIYITSYRRRPVSGGRSHPPAGRAPRPGGGVLPAHEG